MESKEKNIEKIIEEFMFENRKDAYPDECVCYKQGKPCHVMKGLNCFFCYCPEYDTSKGEGGCLRKSKKGKWAYSGKYSTGRIWDCSDCTYPHKKSNVKKLLKKLLFK